MRIAVEGNTFKVRRQGLVLCLDCSSVNPWNDRVYECIARHFDNLHTDLKICVLSWPKELDKLPTQERIEAAKIHRRGRAITPLIESVWAQYVPRQYDLLLVMDADPYDLCDWTTELQSRFRNIYRVKTTELGKTRDEMEVRLLSDLLGDLDSELSLHFDDGIPYEFDGLELSLAESRISLIKAQGSNMGDFVVKASGIAEEVHLLVNDEDASIPSTWPDILPLKNIADESEKEAFGSAIDCYARGENIHPCPSCGTDHGFKRAFLCTKSGNGVLSNQSVMFPSIQRTPRRSGYVLFREQEDGLHWEVVDRPVTRISEHKFLVITHKQEIAVLELSSTIRRLQTKEVFKGLYDLSEDTYTMKLWW